jgi:microcystin-dependent protein
MTSAGGIVRPVIPPRASAGLSEAMTQDINPSAVLRRWGIIKGIRSNGTVDVYVAGQTITAVRRLASYNPTFDERVQIDVVGTDMVVVGATAPSPKNQNWRQATVTAIATNETVTVKFSDDNVIAAGLTRLSTYNPSVNDVVQVGQSTDSGTYIVIGPVRGNLQPYLRRPVGDIEMTIRKSAKPGTLLLDGAEISRTTYADLFAWVQAQGLLTTATAPNNLFGAGNGTSTFVLPNFQGKVPVGADPTTNPVGKVFGSATHSITSANLPNHTHTVDPHPGHTHTLSGTSGGGGQHYHETDARTSADGYHDNHFPDYSYDIMTNGPVGGAISGRLARQPNGESGRRPYAAHNHGVPDNSTEPNHTHAIQGTANANTAQTHNVQSSGGSATPTAISNQPPSYAVNYLIWT